MVINLDEIFTNIKDAIILDEDVTFDNEKYQLPEIKDLKSIHLKGQIELDENEEVILTGVLSGTMTVLDSISLDEVDYELLKTIIYKFNGGPVGAQAIAASIGEEVSTIEDVCEPYLLQIGYLKRTPRGRVVTELAYKHLNIDKD